MVALAALTDVQNALGQQLTSAQFDSGTALLNLASDIVRSYCRQQIDQTLGDVITLPGTWEQRITIPQRPVTNVTSVAVNGATLAAGSYVWDRFGNIDVLSGSFQPDATGTAASSNLWGPAGSTFLNYATGPNWNGPTAVITVTCDHGYAPIPGDIVDIVAGMVASQIIVPIGVLQEKIGGYEVRYIRSPGGGMTLTDDAKSTLNRYRIRTATTSAATRR